MSPRTAAFFLAGVLAVAVAVDLLWMPVQESDSLKHMLDAHASPSVWASFENDLRSDERRVRPLGIAQTKLLFDMADGQQYWLVYRGFHAALLITAVLLFVAVQRVSTGIDLAASAFALVVLVGLRAFRGHVQEAFPINAMVQVVVVCLLTLTLARSRGHWWADVGAVLALIAGALTLETGLLVYVVAVVSWLVGWRGISMRAIAVMTILIAGYAYLRFVVLAIGTPGLPDRSTGFLFTMLEPSDLQQRFGDRAPLLYAYNVAASVLSVLFSEPSGGVFVTTRAWLSGDLLPRVTVPLITSTATTMLIGWAAVRWVRQRPWQFDDTSRFIVLFALVLPANAVLSYSYLKDEIMVVAGVFYALAGFAAMRAALQLVERAPASAKGFGGQAVVAALIVTMAALTVGWTVRAAGMHYLMRSQAFKHQNDWVHTPGELRRRGTWPDDPAAEELVLRLRDAAVRMEVPNPTVGEPRWVRRVWED